MQALRRLESEGFVRINPHKDVVVAGLSAEEFRERFLMMAALEALCLREARRAHHAGAADPPPRAPGRDGRGPRRRGHRRARWRPTAEFHRLLWEASGLKQVVQVLQNVWDRGEYYRVIMHARRGGFAAESLAEHEADPAARWRRATAPGPRAPSRHTGCGRWSAWPRRPDAASQRQPQR